MIRCFHMLLRALFRLSITLVLAVGAGILGWCLMGWINHAPNSPQEIYQAALHPPDQGRARPGNARAKADLLTGRNAAQESTLRQLYQFEQTASPEEKRELWEYSGSDRYWVSILLHPDSSDYYSGSAYVASVLRTWFAGDHKACLEAINNLPPYLQGKIPTRLLKAATLLNGQGVLQLLGPQITGLIPPEGMNVTLHAWAEQDLPGALAFAQQLSSERHRTLALRGVLSAMAGTDPVRSMQLLAEFPAGMRCHVAHEIASEMSPAAVLANYEQLSAHQAGSHAWVAYAKLSASDPVAADQWLQAHPSLWDREKINPGTDPGAVPTLAQLCARTITNDPKLAAAAQKQLENLTEQHQNYLTVDAWQEWLTSQTSPAVIVPALQGLMSSHMYLYSNPSTVILNHWQQMEQLQPGSTAQASTNWIKLAGENLPADEFAPIQALLPTLTPSQQARLFQEQPTIFQPTDALELPFQVQDFQLRMGLENKLVEIYGRDHAEEMDTWISQLPTQEEQASARQSLRSLATRAP